MSSSRRWCCWGTLLAGWLGWLFSGLALQPLRRLAEGVDALPVQPQASALAAGTSNDELGRLASAIDAYQARLLAADTREQAFFADASHELRTPLTVIQGVTDVLLEDPPGPPAQAARLQRLERGVRDMRHLLEAMLSAARRTPRGGTSPALSNTRLRRREASRRDAGQPLPSRRRRRSVQIDTKAPSDRLARPLQQTGRAVTHRPAQGVSPRSPRFNFNFFEENGNEKTATRLHPDRIDDRGGHHWHFGCGRAAG